MEMTERQENSLLSLAVPVNKHAFSNMKDIPIYYCSKRSRQPVAPTIFTFLFVHLEALFLLYFSKGESESQLMMSSFATLT